MKKSIFAFFSILCLAGTAAAQQQTQQTDSTPPAQGWVQANGGTTAYLSTASYPSHDTAWIGGLLLRSVDGGATWNRIDGPAPLAVPYFRSSNYGYLIGSGDSVYRTNDAGETWDTEQTTMPENTTQAMAVASLAIAYVAGSSFIAHTTDSGHTWNSEEVNAPDLTGISFCDPLNGFAVGGMMIGPHPMQQGGGCVKTTDGGKTWVQVWTPTDKGYSSELWSVATLSPEVVVTVGDTILYRTSDGGLTWSEVPSSLVPSPGGLLNIAFKDRFGFAVGGNGVILASSDSGLTWMPEQSGVTADLHSIALYDSAHAIAAGTNGMILVTSNGGQAWVNQNPSAPDSLIITATPNPSNNQVQFSYTLTTGQHVTLTIFNAAGQAVATPLHYVYQAGMESVALDALSFTAGTYYYQFSSENYHQTGSFTIIH